MNSDNWRAHALCGAWPDADLWFREGADRQLALHLCRSHCTVKTQCAAANAGLRNAACVIAGTAYNQHGNISDQQKQSSTDCPTCIAARGAAKPATTAYADCGSMPAYRRHIRNKQVPCRLCSFAAADDRARRREAKETAA